MNSLNSFFNSAIGDAVKVALYVAAAAAVATSLVGATGGHVTIQQIGYAAYIAGANSLLVFLKGMVSNTTPTLPGSSVELPNAVIPQPDSIKLKK